MRVGTERRADSAGVIREASGLVIKAGQPVGPYARQQFSYARESMWADRLGPLLRESGAEDIPIVDDSGWPVGVLPRAEVESLEPPTWTEAAIGPGEDEEEDEGDEGEEEEDEERELRALRATSPHGRRFNLGWGYHVPKRSRVRDLMIPFVPILTTDAPMAEAARLLCENGGQLLAIVDPEERVLVGVFTPRELARWVVAQTRAAARGEDFS